MPYLAASTIYGNQYLPVKTVAVALERLLISGCSDGDSWAPERGQGSGLTESIAE